MRPALWRLAFACALLFAAAVQARPFTIDDLLHLEAIGSASIDPTGRWLLLEHQGPYAVAARFDNNTDLRPLHTHLLRVDLAHPRIAQPAFTQDRASGYLAGPFSPDGAHVVVFRAHDRAWEMGVLTLARRQVRWLGFGAELADLGDTVIWRDAHTVLVLALPVEVRPYRMRLNQAAMDASPALWRKARTGSGATEVAVGGGRYRSEHAADPIRRLLTVDVLNGHTRTLATGVFESLTLSASRHRLALIETGERAPQPAGLLAVGAPWQVRRLHVLDLETGAHTRPCPGQDLVLGGLRWSDTADDLLAYARADTAGWDQAGYVRVDETGRCAPLALEGVTPSITEQPGLFLITPHADWLGGSPLVLGTKGGDRPDWFRIDPTGAVNLTAALKAPGVGLAALRPDAALVLDRGHPYRLDLAAGAKPLGDVVIRRLLTRTRANMTVPSPGDSFDRQEPALALSTGAEGQTLWRLDRDRAIPLARTSERSARVLAGGLRGLITLSDDPHGVQTVALWNRDGQRTPLLIVNPQLEKIAFATPLPIHHTGPRGETLTSWLYRPLAPSKTPPPLLVMAYPSSVYAEPPYGGRPGVVDLIDDNIQLAVAQGFAVLAPSLPADPQSRDPGLGWAAQILPLVDRVTDAGWADPHRVAYWGHSYGGYVGLMLATETTRFRAIIAAAAPTNLVSVRSEASPAAWLSPELPLAVQGMTGWSERGTQGHLLTTPWAEPDRYVRNSPVFHADRISTPILLAQGDQDFISIDQGREMFSNLNRLNKDVLFLTYYGENHTIASPPNVRAYFKAAYAFLWQNLR